MQTDLREPPGPRTKSAILETSQNANWTTAFSNFERSCQTRIARRQFNHNPPGKLRVDHEPAGPDSLGAAEVPGQERNVWRPYSLAFPLHV